MYGALLVACLAAFFWPDRNIVDVPFAELTLKLIAGTCFVLWLGYIAINLAFASFAKDQFWPWRWTKQVTLMLAWRSAYMVGYFLLLWFLHENTKLGKWMDEWPIAVAIISFILVTFAVCADDGSIRGEDSSSHWPVD